MSYLAYATFFNSQGTTYGSGTLGPMTITLDKLLQVDAAFTIGFGPETLPNPTTQSSGLLWGCQWVPTGTTALDITSDFSSNNWLIWKQTNNHTIAVGGDLSNVYSAWLYDATDFERWRGQLPLYTTVDFYFSFNVPSVSQPTIVTYAASIYIRYS